MRTLFVVLQRRSNSLFSYRRCGSFAKFSLPKSRRMEGGRNSAYKDTMAECSSVPAASTASLNVLQNGSFGFYRSVYLATDNTTYMFNCPDTNRRLLSEQGLRRPPTIKHVFFTHGSWQNVSGLAGLAAFLRTVKLKELKLHGPPGLTKIVNVARSFDHLTAVDVDRPLLEDDGLRTYEDSNLVVESVPFTVSDEKLNVIKSYLERRNTEQVGDLTIRADELAVAYICTVKPKWGKVILEKCLEMGVKVGPKIGLLQRGQTVVNRHGQRVHPDQVRGPPFPPQYFGIVECPDERFLDGLFHSATFSRFYEDAQERLDLLLHLSPKRILESDVYQRWMKNFPSSTCHWICNDSSPPICHLDGVYRQQVNMHAVHNEIFPLLWHHRISTKDEDKVEKTNGDTSPFNIALAEPFLKYSFRPSSGFQQMSAEDESVDGDAVGALNSQIGDRKTPALDNFRLETSGAMASGEVYPTVTFLGTSAASPTKYRNVSSILLDLDESTSLMLDCGESTISQLQLFSGKDSYERRLLDIKAVFISHLHLDHHFGLYSLILERRLAHKKLAKPYQNLIVLAASPLFRAHREFSKIVEDTAGLCDFYSTAQDGNLPKSLAEIADGLNLRRIEVVKVIHPQCATGFVLVTKGGKKVVYSGDTRPCEELANKGADADLLIHEATLNDGWETEAITKKHCTKSEAIAVARAMRAKWTILTHFTGLNSKLPYVDGRILKENPNVGLACDFMTVRWDQLPLVPKIVPALFEMHIDGVVDQQGKFGRKRAAVEIANEEAEKVHIKEARVK